MAARAREAPPLTDEDVLAAVDELCSRYHAPSTSLITWRLADGSRVTGAFQSAVRAALQRLSVAGRLACITHRGTHRWSAIRQPGEPPA